MQNPHKILRSFIKPGMVALDLGCGPGFFSIEIAKQLMGSGEVLAADLQEGILNIVRQKLRGTELEQMIKLHQCQEDGIGITTKVDFILAFYMIHEVPNQDKFFNELISLLKPDGTIFIAEPKFHVSKESFEDMIGRIKSMHLEIIDRPRIFFSRTVVLKNKGQNIT